MPPYLILLPTVNYDAARYLRPEIYVQLIKQINNNPDIRSELLGWKVMSIMSQHVEPAPELMEYLRAFLLKHKNRCKGVPELAEIATICSSCYEYDLTQC